MSQLKRFFLSQTVLLCFLLTFTQFSRAQTALPQTPADYQGPFYPVIRQPDEDNDLIHVAGQAQAAQGDILYLTGEVVDRQGNPVKNAVVEIWQTDPQGLYKDKRDRSPGKRNPDFQYWGKAQTAGDGSYSFTTLVPGEYPPRPAHIHFKVWVDGEQRLTSQMYICRPGSSGKKDCLPGISDLQELDLEKTSGGEYRGRFRIVL